MRILFIYLWAICALSYVSAFPKGSKGGSKSGGGIKSGIKSVFKGKSSSHSSSSSGSSSSSFFGTTTPTTTTPSPSTTTQRTTTPISDQAFYENIRRTYCQVGSKISLEEIETAVTCPGQGFTLQLLSTVTANAAALNSSNSTNLENNSTNMSNNTDTTTMSNISNVSNNTENTTSTTTTTPISVVSITSTHIPTPLTPELNNSSPSLPPPLEKTCQSFNSTCFEKMHTFVNECLAEGNSSFSEAYQFDLYLAEQACVNNKTTQIDEWNNGMDKCLSPYFVNGTQVLRKAVADCKKRHSTTTNSILTLTHGYNYKILACVKDKINAPSCTTKCQWGTEGCTPLTTALRNYYVENVISLLLVLERP